MPRLKKILHSIASFVSNTRFWPGKRAHSLFIAMKVIVNGPDHKNHPGIAILHYYYSSGWESARLAKKLHHISAKQETEEEEVGKYNFTSIAKMKVSSI